MTAETCLPYSLFIANYYNIVLASTSVVVVMAHAYSMSELTTILAASQLASSSNGRELNPW